MAKMIGGVTHKELVALGARARLQHLDLERAELLHILQAVEARQTVKRPRRRKMSAAARAAVSARMKKYWAARKKAKK